MRDVWWRSGRMKSSGLVMRLMTTGILVIASTGAAAPVFAQGHRGSGGDGADGPGMMIFGGSPRHLERMLDGLDATEAQRSQIRQIALAAASDFKSGRDAGRAFRERGLQIFTAPSVDAAAAESVRQQMTAQQDQASKRMLQAMLEVANVLTPEQRAKLGERMKASTQGQRQPRPAQPGQPK